MLKRVLVIVAMFLTAFGTGTPAAFAEVQVLTVHLAPSGDPDGSGVAIVRLNSERDLVCYSAVVRDISAPTEPRCPEWARRTSTAPCPLVPVSPSTSTPPSRRPVPSTYIARDCVSADSATIAAVLANPERFYFNVHNADGHSCTGHTPWGMNRPRFRRERGRPGSVSVPRMPRLDLGGGRSRRVPLYVFGNVESSGGVRHRVAGPRGALLLSRNGYPTRQ